MLDIGPTLSGLPQQIFFPPATAAQNRQTNRERHQHLLGQSRASRGGRFERSSHARGQRAFRLGSGIGAAFPCAPMPPPMVERRGQRHRAVKPGRQGQGQPMP